MLERYISPRELRRIDHYSQLALLGAHLALEDAGVAAKDLKRLGVAIATGYGPSRSMFKFLDSILNDGIACASPSHFAASVHITASAYIAMKLGIEGPDHTVSQFEMSLPSALLTACAWLEEDRLDAVLLGGVDEYCDVLGYSWRRFFEQGDDVEMCPLDTGRQSAVPGEGAAFLLLTRGKGAGGYAVVRETDTAFRSQRITATVPSGAVLLLGADGCKNYGSKYHDIADQGRDVVCYTPLYGSLPVGFGFQLAAAALMVKEGKIFATPAPPPVGGPFHAVVQEQDLDARPVSCILRGAGKNLAATTLST
jgi:3-oxoacyl-[acyl-carrier-protein] synthase II